MNSIIQAAPAKINLSLRITGKRDDGYHLLESLVVFAEYGDVVEVGAADEISLEIIGEFSHCLVNESIEKNLVWKAAAALQEYAKTKNIGLVARGGARIILTKNLPVGSGIGGGSADAAATLIALCKLWKLNITNEELAEICLKLGSDVPVCLHGCLYGKPALMRGVGEKVQTAEQPAEKYLVLINPNLPLSTAEVFQQFSLTGQFRPVLPDEGRNLRAELVNDLQPAAITKMPIIAELLAVIEKTENCKFAAMSGSGATCFGLYESEKDAISAKNEIKKTYPQIWCVNTKILGE